jgi:sugar phosphate isomerase/epimerase
MALRLGAYTACLHDLPLSGALDVLQADGLTSAEVDTGGFIPSPHCHVDLLLSSAQGRRDHLDVFAARGMELTGLNGNGNPLNPLPGVGPKHADDLRRTIEHEDVTLERPDGPALAAGNLRAAAEKA